MQLTEFFDRKDDVAAVFLILTVQGNYILILSASPPDVDPNIIASELLQQYDELIDGAEDAVTGGAFFLDSAKRQISAVPELRCVPPTPQETLTAHMPLWTGISNCSTYELNVENMPTAREIIDEALDGNRHFDARSPVELKSM